MFDEDRLIGFIKKIFGIEMDKTETDIDVVNTILSSIICLIIIWFFTKIVPLFPYNGGCPYSKY